MERTSSTPSAPDDDIDLPPLVPSRTEYVPTLRLRLPDFLNADVRSLNNTSESVSRLDSDQRHPPLSPLGLPPPPAQHRRQNPNMERHRNYYMQYYLRVRSNMPMFSNEANPDFIPIRGTNSGSSAAQDATATSNLTNTLSPMLASVATAVVVRRPPNAGGAGGDGGGGGSSTNEAVPVANAIASAMAPNDDPRRRLTSTNDLFRDVFHGTFLPLQAFGSNYQNGLTKQEINRHTVSYEYKPRKRQRVKCAHIGGELDSKETALTAGPQPNSACESDSCSICLDRFCASINVRRLPCLHVFHIRCIDKWLKQNKKCPICRIAITINYENLISSLESGSSIEQCLSQQELPDHSVHATGLGAEFPDLQSMIRNRLGIGLTARLTPLGIFRMDGQGDVPEPANNNAHQGDAAGSAQPQQPNNSHSHNNNNNLDEDDESESSYNESEDQTVDDD